MRYSEWLERTGFSDMGYYHDLNRDMSLMLDGETEILAAVLDKSEDLEDFNWKKSYILLTEDKLITGHIGYRVASVSSQEGLEVVASAIPLRSISSVTSQIVRTTSRGFPEQRRKYRVEFGDGRAAVTLPPESSDRSVSANEYIELGRALLKVVR